MLTRLAFVVMLLAPALCHAAEDVRRRVAVLEYRGGVDNPPDLAIALAERMKKTAALEILDLRDARRAQQGVDGSVARCAGDPDCTARVGGKLDVDEVLLVAMSQLGDLVVNLQRIDVVSGKVTGVPVSAVLPSHGTIETEQIDAWLRQLYPPTVFKRYGYIAITANVDGAAVSINGQVRGETPLDGRIKVAAGKSYRVSVTKQGRVSFAARIDVVADSTVEVRAELPESEGRTAWYKKWYPWAIMGVVVAGAGIGAALYITRPDDSKSSAVLMLPAN